MTLADNWRTVRRRAVGRPGYFKLTPQMYELRRAFRRYAAPHIRGRVLDAGAGYGAWRSELTRAGAARVIGVDRAALAGADVVCDLKRPPFRDGVFDTAFCSQVLEHDAAPAVITAELARVLGKGGRLVVTAPMTGRVHDAPHDYFRYTAWGLAALADAAGLTVVGVYPCGGLLSVLKHYWNQGFLALVARVPWLNVFATTCAQVTTPVWAALDRFLDRGGRFAANHLLIARKDG